MAINRRILFSSLCAGGLVSAFAMNAALAQNQDGVVKIGYAVSLTGPNSGGAMTTIVPNYRLWVAEINEKGGLLVGDKRLPVEVIEYDDRSNSEEAVRAVERLITQDRVDILLSPWGTAMNLAVGPLFDRHGYPLITATGINNRVEELAQRWPRSFWLSGTSASWAEALVEVLVEARDAGNIGNEIAMISVADGFGIDLSAAARNAFGEAGFALTYDRSYPVGTQDFSSMLSEVRDAQVFVAFSYPPDTVAITDQAQLHAFNPDIFYAGVGGSFPMFRERFGDTTEGMLTLGGLNFGNQATHEYIKKHVAVIGREPDYGGSIVTYSALQAMEQAIERVGSLDGDAIAEELKSGTFQTAMGEINLAGQVMPNVWKVGQVRDGYLIGVGPRSNEGAGEVILPKQPWPAR